MKNIFHNFPVLLLCLLLSGCNKYLDITPKGKSLLKTVNDFNLWLGNRTLGEASGIHQVSYMTDHAQVIPWDIQLVSKVVQRTYTWQEQFSDANVSDPMWTGPYGNIYYYNTVINNIDAATDGTPEEKRRLKAEALLGRAYEYFFLVNLYGKPYKMETASTDLGVPFVTFDDISKNTPNRSTVQQLYTQIIEDILTAVEDLPVNNNTNRFRGSVHAAYSVLARVYFYMRNYSEAAKYANMALQRPGGANVTNYNGVTRGLFSRNTRLNEAIYARGCDVSSYGVLRMVDSAFIKSYTQSDLRPALFFYNGTSSLPFNYNTVVASSGVRFSTSSSGYYDVQAGTTVSEMKLIIAEYAARNNELTTALDHLNDIRINRFLPANYVALDSDEMDVVLSWVFRERKYEMPFNGLRWFDMRRLDTEGRMPAVNRYDEAGNIISTLAPGSIRYTLQIPTNELVFNPHLIQNP